MRLGDGLEFDAGDIVATAPRVVRGSVGPTGTILAGSGFSVSKAATGRWTVTFTDPFDARPVVTVTAYLIGGVAYAPAASLHDLPPATTGFTVNTAKHDGGGVGTPVDSGFDFIAVG